MNLIGAFVEHNKQIPGALQHSIVELFVIQVSSFPGPFFVCAWGEPGNEATSIVLYVEFTQQNKSYLQKILTSMNYIHDIKILPNDTFLFLIVPVYHAKSDMCSVTVY